MRANQKIIMLKGSRIHFSPQFSLGWEDTNLPTHFFMIRPNLTRYWKVEITDFEPTTQSIHFEVVDYDPEESQAFFKQNMRKPVERIVFSPLDWHEFEKILAGYNQGALASYMLPLEEELTTDAEEWTQSFDLANVSPKSALSPMMRSLIYQERSTDQIEYDIPIHSIQFGLGIISFPLIIPYLQQTITVDMVVDSSIPELNYIRGFIPKVLGKDEIHCSLHIVFENGEITEVVGSGKDLDHLAYDMLTRVKILRMDDWLSRIKRSTEEPILAEAPLDSLEEDSAAGYFPPVSLDQIFDYWTQHAVVRNHRELAYLATHLHDPKYKIRITGVPQLGFIFFHKGKQGHHYIWELLDSNATYIWSFQRNHQARNHEVKQVEQAVAYIHQSGRKQYRSLYKYEHSTFHFKAIHHDDIESPFVNGMAKWKNHLTEQLF